MFESEILVRMTTSVVRAFLFAITNKNFTSHTAATIPHAVMGLTKGGEEKYKKGESLYEKQNFKETV